MICHEMDGVIDSYHSDHCQIYERKCEEFHRQLQSGFVPTGLACVVPAASSVLVTLAARSHSLSRLDGATAGGLAGLVGLMALEVRCPNLDGYQFWCGTGA